MKLHGCFALAAAVVAISASVANANDASFFNRQAITLGDLQKVSYYAGSALETSYSECASCAGKDEAVAAPGYAVPVFDAQPVYYDSYVVYDPYVSYGEWTPVRNTLGLARDVVVDVARGVARPVSRVVNGVRNFLFNGGYDYCRPAYFCDPCWSCDPCWTCDPCGVPAACDPCAPCGIPAACDPCGFVSPRSVWAPKACCGYDVYPGEVNELDSETGLPKKPTANGIDSATNSATAPAADNAPALPATLSTEPAAPKADAPAPQIATPAADSLLDQPAPADDLPAWDGDDAEAIPTPAPNPNLGAGVIRMLVPEDAIVYVNGYRTKQRGEVRSFAARDLVVGEAYSFEIRVVALRDGERFEDVQTTVLTAGETTALAFNLVAAPRSAYAVNAR